MGSLESSRRHLGPIFRAICPWYLVSVPGNHARTHQTERELSLDDSPDSGSRPDETAVAIHQLEDLMANILGWLPVYEIMGKRRVCKKCSEAATKTIVSLTDFDVNSLVEFNAMNVMTTKLPNLQQKVLQLWLLE